MKRSEADHSSFYCYASPKKCVYLIVYVDDIVITGNDAAKISQLKYLVLKWLNQRKVLSFHRENML